MTSAQASAAATQRPNVVTVASIGAIACVVADMVHEALGHGTASWLTGDRILSLSTVAIQTLTANRAVSLAGTLANCIVGAIALLAMGRMRRLTSASYFLWAFGAYNLLNSGYLMASAIMNNGDWAVVISGLSPAWLWRCVLFLAGAAVYYITIRWTATLMRGMVDRGDVALADLQRLILPAYLAGGVVMTIASVFNPISPSLILPSGAGPSFGLNAALLFLPGIVGSKTKGGNANGGRIENQTARVPPLSFSIFWFVLALVVCGVFIGFLGPGIQFPQ